MNRDPSARVARIMRPHMRIAVAATLTALVAVVAPAAASAHEGGKPEPRISAAIVPKAELQGRVLVGLTDIDTGEVIPGAEVTVFAEMTRPHVMRTQPVRLPETAPGSYAGTLQFLMPGTWTLHVEAGGPDVISADAEVTTRVRLAETPNPTPPIPGDDADPPVRVLPTTIDDVVTEDDAARMVSLWLHALAALGWIVGVLVMAVALSTRPGVLAEAARTRLARAYTSWGAWVHWGLVLVIVATGVYQMLYVTPFPLAYTPEGFTRLAEIPYGLLYEAILVAKLALFGVLVLSGTVTLLRVLDAPLPVIAVTNPHPGFFRILGSALGPAGVVYLLTVPLILAAAMALRYVHVLAHVAEVVRTGS